MRQVVFFYKNNLRFKLLCFGSYVDPMVSTVIEVVIINLQLVKWPVLHFMCYYSQEKPIGPQTKLN
jgi:hypothetical protein